MQKFLFHEHVAIEGIAKRHKIVQASFDDNGLVETKVLIEGYYGDLTSSRPGIVKNRFVPMWTGIYDIETNQIHKGDDKSYFYETVGENIMFQCGKSNFNYFYKFNYETFQLDKLDIETKNFFLGHVFFSPSLKHYATCNFSLSNTSYNSNKIYEVSIFEIETNSKLFTSPRGHATPQSSISSSSGRIKGMWIDENNFMYYLFYPETDNSMVYSCNVYNFNIETKKTEVICVIPNIEPGVGSAHFLKRGEKIFLTIQDKYEIHKNGFTKLGFMSIGSDWEIEETYYKKPKAKIQYKGSVVAELNTSSYHSFGNGKYLVCINREEPFHSMSQNKVMFVNGETKEVGLIPCEWWDAQIGWLKNK